VWIATACEGFDASISGSFGLGQDAGRVDHVPRGDRVPSIGLELPAMAFLVERRRRDLGPEPHSVAQAEALRAVLGVIPKLLAGAYTRVQLVRFAYEY